MNATVSGKLIRNSPPAVSCYPGPKYNKEECAHVGSQWSNTTFQSEQPIGYCYPIDNSCPVTNFTWQGKCSLGPSPVYTINATEPEELVAGISFARVNNVRLVIRNTGHDLLGKYVSTASLSCLPNKALDLRDTDLSRSGFGIFAKGFCSNQPSTSLHPAQHATGPARRLRFPGATFGTRFMRKHLPVT